MKGFFDYKQYQLNALNEELQDLLSRQGQKKDENNLHFDPEFYKKYPEEQFFPVFPEKIQEKIKESIKYLSITYSHINHLDSFLSGDCSEEMALERLEKDLKELS